MPGITDSSIINNVAAAKLYDENKKAKWFRLIKL